MIGHLSMELWRNVSLIYSIKPSIRSKLELIALVGGFIMILSKLFFK